MVGRASRVLRHRRSGRGPLALTLVCCLACPHGLRAQDAWPFDPKERYQAGIEAFEAGEHGLAVELWMDILGHEGSPELGAQMIRLIGENVVSGLEASLNAEPGRAKTRKQALEFCSVYSKLHAGHAHSQVIEDACVNWSSSTPARVEAVVPIEPAKASVSSLAPTPAPVPAPASAPVSSRLGSETSSDRSPQLKAGLGLLFSAAATSAVTLGGLFAEGLWMRDYHTSIFNKTPDPRLRDRADGWRTVAVVTGGMSLALITVGTVLCITGTRTPKRKRSAKSLSLHSGGLWLRF